MVAYVVKLFLLSGTAVIQLKKNQNGFIQLRGNILCGNVRDRAGKLRLSINIAAYVRDDTRYALSYYYASAPRRGIK